MHDIASGSAWQVFELTARNLEVGMTSLQGLHGKFSNSQPEI